MITPEELREGFIESREALIENPARCCELLEQCWADQDVAEREYKEAGDERVRLVNKHDMAVATAQIALAGSDEKVAEKAARVVKGTEMERLNAELAKIVERSLGKKIERLHEKHSGLQSILAIIKREMEMSAKRG